MGRKILYATGAIAALLAIFFVSFYIGTCTIHRSVRLGPAAGLRVLEAIDTTRLPRLPWSFGPVPQRYELTTPHYRIVFATPDGTYPYGLFIESATAGDEDVSVEGNRIIGPHGGLFRYHVAVTDYDVNTLVFTVRDQSGNVLGNHSLPYSLERYSYLCGFQGI
jgi:hypothetical protein